jgi:hypothetical protein
MLEYPFLSPFFCLVVVFQRSLSSPALSCFPSVLSFCPEKLSAEISLCDFGFRNLSLSSEF